MNKRVILSLGRGSLESGFREVNVQLWVETENLPRLRLTATLPPAPEVVTCYRDWQMLHKAFSQRLSRSAGIEIVSGFKNWSEENFSTLCQRLKQTINDWLDTKDFRQTEKEIRTELDKEDEILVIVETSDDLVWRLPWHLWRFLEDYDHAEVVLSHPEFKKINATSKTLSNCVRILGILGDRTGINVDEDQKILKQLKGAVPDFLVEKERKDINDALWEKPCDILFFAGHSTSQTEDAQGKIYINSHSHNNSLTVEQLTNALRKAIDAGLFLAIFNSCDGLGLARKLAQLNLPHVIVMREDVPNKVAEEFLKYFLEEFAGKGTSLALAVRRARERLEGLEDEFPCAGWLPVLCQNQATIAPTWQDLLGNFPTPSPPPKVEEPRVAERRFRFIKFMPVMLASMLCTGLVMGLRWQGILQPYELRAFDQLMRWRPSEGKDPRILIVTINDEDINYQKQRGMKMQGSLSDQALVQLLEKLKQHQPKVIGLDIYRDAPTTDPKYTNIATSLRNENFIDICQIGGGDNNSPKISPPQKVPIKHVGFSDLSKDPDRFVRRQIFGMSYALHCATDKSFSFQLARRYLNLVNKNIKIKRLSPKSFQIGNVIFPKSEQHTGGYHNLDTGGYEVLLNYRAAEPVAEQIPLREILNGSRNSQLPNLVTNRIILIGVTSKRYDRDYHLTPYSAGQETLKEIPGVVVQAHMVSQVINAVLNQRPVLWWWSQWGDTLWVASWCLITGIWVWCWRSRLQQVLVVGGVCGSLYVICFIVLWLEGGWMPLIPSLLATLITSGFLIFYTSISGSLTRANISRKK